MKPVDRKKVAARRPIHPGIIFAEEVMPELRRNRTIGEIATLLGVSRQTLHRVMVADIAISSEMAVRLGKLCGSGPGIWIRLQGALRYLGSCTPARQSAREDTDSGRTITTRVGNRAAFEAVV